MTDPSIRAMVFSNLDNAKENGSFEKDGYLDGADADEIAADLVALAADLEDFDPVTIHPYVEEWLRCQNLL